MRDLRKSGTYGNDQKDNGESALEDVQPRSQISWQPLSVLLEARTNQCLKEKLITKSFGPKLSEAFCMIESQSSKCFRERLIPDPIEAYPV